MKTRKFLRGGKTPALAPQTLCPWHLRDYDGVVNWVMAPDATFGHSGGVESPKTMVTHYFVFPSGGYASKYVRFGFWERRGCICRQPNFFFHVS